MPKMNMLDMVNNILSDMDSELVVSLDDTLEAEQVSNIIKNTYYDLISHREWPELNAAVNLTSYADSSKPTTFAIPDSVAKIHWITYRIDDATDFTHREMKIVTPAEFIRKTDMVRDNYVEVTIGGTTVKIKNDEDPTFYTVFDDNDVVFNSYNASEGATLVTSYIRCYAKTLPTFSTTDPNFVPALDAEAFSYFLAEAKNQAFSLLKGGIDPMINQAARRHKSYIQNDKYKTQPKRALSTYGRS